MSRRSQPAAPLPGRPAIPWRALVVGTLLLPINAFWLVQMEMATSGALRGTTDLGPYPSTLSLFANVIFLLAALAALNAALRRLRRAWALSQNELLIVYVMLTIGTCLASVDFLDVLFPMLGHPTRYATASNGWNDLFVRYLPSWLSVRDADALKGWYTGSANPYAWAHLRAWIVPVLAWSAFTLTLLFVMFCMNTLLRIQWTRNEKLSYPIIQLPLDMTDPSGSFYRQRLLWAGFAVAGGISLLNGMAVLLPGISSLPIKSRDLTPFFPNPPLNAMGWTPISLFPFAVGMGFLLPADMLFSSWFFCLTWRVQRIVSSYFGWASYSPSFPYVNEQSFGAYMGVAALAIWGLRQHLATVVRQAWEAQPLPDQPISYRAALIGVVLGTIALILFFHAAGVPLWACAAGFLLYFAIALACTRMRAELGPPAHDLHNGGPDYILTAVFGSRAFTPQALTGLTWFYWFNRAYRTIAMPYQMEAFKIGEQRGISMRGISLALLISSLVGLASGCWALYAIGYTYGAEAKMASHFPGFGWEAYNRLSGWILSPRDTDVPAALAILVGLGFTLLLQMARMRFSGSPFHPLGYAVSGSFSLSTLWMPLLIAWIFKVSLLRYGGLAAYRRALPFFLGLILGDFLIGCGWHLFGWLLGVNTYSFYF